MDQPLAHIGVDRPRLRPDLADAARALHQAFDDRLDERQVDEVLDVVAAQFEDATVRAFVPLLVQRLGRELLTERLEHPVVDLRDRTSAEIA